jgi:uncharacterized membrane protein YbhN (UPF0104 family)
MRKNLWRVLAVAISVALLAWVATSGHWQGVGARLARLDAVELAGVTVLFAASYAMRGARIHGEFRDELVASGHGHGSYPRILRLTLVHNALVNLLPFRSGEVAFPVLLSRWFGIGTGRAVVSLLWLRAQDATVVLALAALVWPGLPTVWRVSALVAIVAGAASVPLWARRLRGSLGRLAKLPALLERATRRTASGWAWTVANWSVKLIAETWLMALALGSSGEGAHVASAALGAIGCELGAILPVQGIAGFGTFEAGGAALMRMQGLALENGLEAALALHAVVLVLASIAGLLAAVALPGPRR